MQGRADAHAMFRAVGSANDFASEKVQPEPYDIPYRSLVPRGIQNPLVAGRCDSATRGAHASTRVTENAMAMGETAGIEASMSLKENILVATLHGPKVRGILR